jgi:hypothetical protein
VKYALLIYGDENAWANATEEERRQTYAEYGKFSELLGDRGLAGEELDHTSTATTVRDQGGGFVLTDGPFAETTEQLAGFVIVEARDLDEALELARALPAETVEVRPVAPPPPPQEQC